MHGQSHVGAGVDSACEALAVWLAATHTDGGLISLYEGRTLQWSGTDSAAAVATLRALAILAGAKGWSGRCDVGELTATVRIDPPAAIATVAPTVDKVGEAAAKSLADGLRASQAHAHAMASLLVQTVQQFGAGAAAILAANERALTSLVERAERAEQGQQRAMALLDQTVEAAEIADRDARKAREDLHDLTTLAKHIAGPSINKLIAQASGGGEGLGAALGFTPPATQEAAE